MNKIRFNFPRYRLLLIKENTFDDSKRSLLSSSEFFELIKLRAIVYRQMIYDQRKEYFLLIKKYINKSINFSEFRSAFLRMETEYEKQAEQLLNDYKRLESFTYANDLEEIVNVINEISSLCSQKVDFGLLEKEFYDLVNKNYLQLKKSFDDSII